METGLERLDGGVAVVRIDRPEARNALNGAVREQLAQHFRELAADETVRCAIITGSDKVFAAGADIKAMAQATAAEMMLRGSHLTWGAIKEFPKPLIAAVNGWALGGGCELALHADIIIAGEGAKFGQPEIRVGIIPGAGGTQRLTRAVGKYKAMKILLSGEPVAAREAEAMGLVSEVVPDSEVFSRALASRRPSPRCPRSRRERSRRWCCREPISRWRPALPSSARHSAHVRHRRPEGRHGGLHREAPAPLRGALTMALDPNRPDLTLGIVGSGVMGRGIAQVAAEAGMTVLLAMRGLSRG
jgi:enoyl-CoA hydratase/carnithine racemase